MTAYANYSAVRFQRDGAILTVAMSNPEARNACSRAMHEELPRAFAEIAKDRAVHVVVLTGDPAGGAFCAGGDLTWIQEVGGNADKFAELMQDGRDIVRNMLDTPQPIIAMINGPAIGLGCTLALLCDLAYMDEEARIADPHVLVGVVAGDGGAVIWPLLIGPNRAKEFLMTGEALSGRDAARIGLVNHALPADDLREAVYSMARRLAGGPRLAIEWTKRSVNLGLQLVANTVLPASLALEGLTFNTLEHREAVATFLAKGKAGR